MICDSPFSVKNKTRIGQYCINPCIPLVEAISDMVLLVKLAVKTLEAEVEISEQSASVLKVFIFYFLSLHVALTVPSVERLSTVELTRWVPTKL